MEEALRKIEAALKEKRPVSRIDGLLPAQSIRPPDQAGGLGIEHYGKVSMVVEAGAQDGGAARSESPEVRPAPAQPYQDAGSRIAAGSKELSLDELSAQGASSGEMLKTQQLGGSRFHEISLDELSTQAKEEGSDG